MLVQALTAARLLPPRSSAGAVSSSATGAVLPSPLQVSPYPSSVLYQSINRRPDRGAYYHPSQRVENWLQIISIGLNVLLKVISQSRIAFYIMVDRAVPCVNVPCAIFLLNGKKTLR